ncbi:MAG: Fic family protein [Nanoarchaeota archaeon]|nr:Fic family protein [Nanoarchaeota archaeon]
MVFIQERKAKGEVYLYIDKSIRIGKKVHKISRFLGKKSEVSPEKIKMEKKKFALEIDTKIVLLLVAEAKKRYPSFEFPLTIEEIKKIEEMNLQYKEIRRSLNKKDWEDVKKRFVANFVFESNALEGNSLTLKNFSEIVFENKIIASADLREVYDAKNSYDVFSKLFDSKKEISGEFIIELHKKLMKNVDQRVGYKKLPNIILGRAITLTAPENVSQEMKNLLKWYQEKENKIYPLELAFKFHHKFEQIHPFADGNGRVGRMLLNHILIRKGYYPIIIRNNHRNKYINALQSADLNRYILLIRFGIEKAKETYRKFFEVYYQYI